MFDDGNQTRHLVGQELHSSDGTRIGTIGRVYLDDEDDPEWVTVDTGPLGSHESFVPLAQATVFEDGLVVPYSKSQVRAAPDVGADGSLSEEQERILYQHYGLSCATEGPGSAHRGQASGPTR